jgi:hypothetical protein
MKILFFLCGVAIGMWLMGVLLVKSGSVRSMEFRNDKVELHRYVFVNGTWIEEQQ